MNLIDFLSAYGYLVVVGFQAILVGISGLFYIFKNRNNPDVLEKKREKLLNKLARILTLLGYKDEDGE